MGSTVGTPPHDPPSMDDPRCYACDEPWPCAERRRQRAEWKLIRSYIESDLYELAVPRHAEPGWGPRWQSPLNWWVDWTYGEIGLRIRIGGRVDSDELWASTDNADLAWIEENLP